ncbi:MAG: protein phosphatase 2C domain-containing protein [Polyangiaceae bacterium]
MTSRSLAESGCGCRVSSRRRRTEGGSDTGPAELARSLADAPGEVERCGEALRLARMLSAVTQVIPRFFYRVDIGAATEMGLRRSVLQDAHLVAEQHGVIAIADGIGGIQGGDRAARMALDEVSSAMATETTQRVAQQYVSSPDLETRRLVRKRLTRVVERVNEAVYRLGREQEPPGQLGTTLDIAWLLRDEVFLAHVGDSRVDLVRTNAVLQVTEDHSEPTHRGTPNTTRSKRAQPARLTNAIGLAPHVNVDTVLVELRRGDCLALLTDGVWTALSSEGELDRLARGSSMEHAARNLVQFAKGTSYDDRTAVVLECIDRFVRHESRASGSLVSEIEPLAESALFIGMAWPRILAVLSVAIQVEFEAGERIPHWFANDRVSYVVLEGIVRRDDGKRLGQGAALYAEGLVGCEPSRGLYECEELVRAIRVRREDFHEVCASDPLLAAELYRRLAEHLGQKLSG